MFSLLFRVKFTVTSSGEELHAVIVLHLRDCRVVPVGEVGAASLRPLPDA